MKKILLVSLALTAASVGFAQDSLIAGFGFGQFIGSGYPSTDGTTGDPVGFIPANFQGSLVPANTTAGVYRVNNNVPGVFNPGYATWYWDGSNGSSLWNNTNGIDVVVFENGSLNSLNQATVGGTNLNFADTNFAGLSFAITGQKWSIVTNTSAYADTATANNFSFAAFGTGGSASIEWFINGSSTSFASTTVGAGNFSSYSVDLPAEFYGNSNASIQGRLTSGIVTFDNVQINGATSAVPEPSTYGLIGGAVVLVGALTRRRRSVTSA